MPVPALSGWHGRWCPGDRAVPDDTGPGGSAPVPAQGQWLGLTKVCAVTGCLLVPLPVVTYCSASRLLALAPPVTGATGGLRAVGVGDAEGAGGGVEPAGDRPVDGERAAEVPSGRPEGLPASRSRRPRVLRLQSHHLDTRASTIRGYCSASEPTRCATPPPSRGNRLRPRPSASRRFLAPPPSRWPEPSPSRGTWLPPSLRLRSTRQG